MKNLYYFFCFFLTTTVFSQTFPDLIIKDVNVIPMTYDTVFMKKSVSIYKGKILEIGDFVTIKKNSKTKIINSHNKYLLPGLTEMHIHLPEPEMLDTFITTMVAAGVTHVRVMFSPAPVLNQKKVIASLSLQPKIYYPYLLTINTNARNEEQWDSLFTKIVADKYDFVKLYSIQHRKDFSDTIFDRMMVAANKYNVIVCGHYPAKVRLTKVLISGFKSIEHLAGYTELPDDKLDLALDVTKEYSVYNCPTLDWDVMAYDLPFPDKYKERMVLYNAPLKYINSWNAQLEAAIKKNGSEKILIDKGAYMPTYNKKLKILKRLSETGNLLLLGGESGNLFQLPGFNMFEEMLHWSEAGIKTFDILKAVTYNPAKFFNESDLRGSIEPGKEASLILLDENPLFDIKNMRSVHATIIKGTIFYKTDLLKKI